MKRTTEDQYRTAVAGGIRILLARSAQDSSRFFELEFLSRSLPIDDMKQAVL